MLEESSSTPSKTEKESDRPSTEFYGSRKDIRKVKTMRSSKFKNMALSSSGSEESDPSIMKPDKTNKVNLRKSNTFTSKISYGFTPMNRQLRDVTESRLIFNKPEDESSSQNKTEKVSFSNVVSFVKPSKTQGILQKRKILNLNMGEGSTKTYVCTHYSH
jgi:hypothetical protein